MTRLHVNAQESMADASAWTSFAGPGPEQRKQSSSLLARNPQASGLLGTFHILPRLSSIKPATAATALSICRRSLTLWDGFETDVVSAIDLLNTTIYSFGAARPFSEVI